MDIRRFSRRDAALVRPELYEYLEAKHDLYAIRLPANQVLPGETEALPARPVGRPSNKPVVWYHDFSDNQVRLRLFALSRAERMLVDLPMRGILASKVGCPGAPGSGEGYSGHPRLKQGSPE